MAEGNNGMAGLPSGSANTNGLPNSGIMSMFNIGGPAPQPPGMQQPAATGNIPGTGTGDPVGNTGLPGTGGTGTDDGKSPLDAFKTLWDTPTDGDGKPIVPASNTPSVAFDPAKVAEAIGKVDFLSQIPQDLLAKATSGDAQAFSQVMNQSNRAVFMMAAASFTKLMQQQTEQQQKQLEAMIPDLVRKHGARDALMTDPVFSHSAVSPLVEAVSAQIQRKHPQATQAQIAELARDYIKNSFSALNAALGDKGGAGDKGGNGGNGGARVGNMTGSASDDWEAWIQQAPAI